MNTIETLPPGSEDIGSVSSETPSSGRPDRRGSLVGLIGLVVAFVAIGSLFALQQPPFVGADEKAHLGYAHVVADGDLPRVDTRLPVPTWADQWMSEVIYTHEDENRSVWVANHPPLYYVSTVPLIMLADHTERPDGGLLPMRLANVAYGAIGVIFTYFIALELSRSARIALLSAAAATFVTQFYASLSLAMSDGMTYAAGAAVTWAGLRCLRRGTTPVNLALLSVLTVIATGARAVTMLVAFAVIGVVALADFRDRRAAGAAGGAWRALVRVGLIGTVPAAIAWGWFYVRNIVLYGDIGASSYLLERFDRQPNGSLLATLNNGDLWRSLYFRSMSPFTYGGAHPRGMMLVAALAVGGLVGVWLTRRTGDRDERGQQYVVARRSIVLLAVTVGVIAVYIAQHVSGGGYLHPRYAFPVIGAVATLLIIGLDRILPRLLPLGVVVAMGIWTIRQLPVGIDPSNHSRPRDSGRLAPAALRTLPGGEFWRWIAVCGIVLGVTVAAASLLVVTLSRWRRPPSDVGDTPVRSTLDRWRGSLGIPTWASTNVRSRPTASASSDSTSSS